MKSIMQNEQESRCYLCMTLHSDFSKKQTQEHHAIFGTANRRLSEKYGLKVYLCLDHHTTGRESVHRNKKSALLVKKEAQKAFEKRWPALDFQEIFGKNFLEEADRIDSAAGQQASEKDGGSGFLYIGAALGKGKDFTSYGV